MNQKYFNLHDFETRSVKDMSPDDQPREKLKKYGTGSLSDSELFAILLRTGSTKMNVLDMSRALLNHFEGLRNLARQDWQSLKIIPGIGGVKAVTLQAVFELSRRIQIASMGEKVIFSSPDQVAAYFGPLLRDLQQEQFIVAFLNNAKVLTGYKKISSGGRNATVVEPADVLRSAILNHANSIILVHNHPSGRNKESQSDIKLTKRIADISQLIGIPVDDHIIIAGDDYISLRAKNLF